jgi:predicted GNAT family acetyltransferase
MHYVDNVKERKFVATIDGYSAFIEYSVEPDIVILEHIEVDEELSGRGIASELTESVLLGIESRGLKVIPKCPFIKSYIEKRPEWESILA